MHCAAAPGGDTRRSIMQALLRAGADVNATSGDGVTTPLRLSCMNAAAGCVEELLHWGADDVTSFALPSPGLSASSSSSPSSSDRNAFVSASSPATFSCSTPGASTATAPAAAVTAPGAATAATAATAAATSFAGVQSPPAPPHSPPSARNIETAPGSNNDELAQHALHCRPDVSDDPRFRLPPLGDVIGSRVPLSARDVADCRTILQVLRRIPLDRAWRRRGWLCMLYTRASRKARGSCALRGSLSCLAPTAASSAAFAGGKPDAHQGVVNPCTTFVKLDALVDGVSTRSRSSKETEPGMHGVSARRGGLGVATSCETSKRKASDDNDCGNVSSVIAGREWAEPTTCSCAGTPNKDTRTNNLYSANEKARRTSRATERRLVGRAGKEEMQRKTFHDLIGRLFEVQGDQSIVRKVIAWL